MGSGRGFRNRQGRRVRGPRPEWASPPSRGAGHPLAVLPPVRVPGAVLALGACEDVLLPPPAAGPEREPTPLDVMRGRKA
ncbi:hypothetical protein GCM10018987_06970 [Streptomyces cremeus]